MNLCQSGTQWPPGSLIDKSSNTLGCRQQAAQQAADAPEKFCGAAGFSGGNQCGSWCPVFCDLKQKNCPPDNQSMANCLLQCATLTTSGSPGDSTGDSVQCRIFHAAYAGVEDSEPTDRCAATAIVDSPLCRDTPVQCDTYCAALTTACGTSNPNEAGYSTTASFPSHQSCVTFCEKHLSGSPGSELDTALSCRLNRAREAILDPSLCADAGPLGGTTCADDCDVACEWLSKSCESESDETELCPILCKTGLDGADTHQQTLDCWMNIITESLRVDGLLNGNACWQAFNPMDTTCSPYNCGTYCQEYFTSCAEDLGQSAYDNVATCIHYCASWAQFPANTSSPDSGNDVYCRLEALRDDALPLVTRCRRAGPYSDGTCGSQCENLGGLIDTHCPDVDPVWSSGCLQNCPTDFAQDGSTTDVTGNSVQCRLNHLGLPTMLGTISLEEGCQAALPGGICNDE